MQGFKVIMLLKKIDLQKWLQLILKVFFVVVASLVLFISPLFISIKYTSIVTMDTNEIPIISQNPFSNCIFLCLVVLAFIAVQPILNKINSKFFLTVIITIFLVLSLYLIHFSSTTLRQSDPKNCLEIANHLNSGEYSDFKSENYLGWYPYQIYWITFLRPLLAISHNIKLFYLLNSIYICIIFVISYKITALFTNNNSTLNNVSLLSILFLPNLFNVLFIYGNIPGYMFFMLSIYFFIRV